MYGYIKLQKQANSAIKKHYKKYYCTLCKAIEQHYGEKARMLLSYDTTFFFVLFAEENYIQQIKKITCIGKTKKLKEVLNQETAKQIATFNILLFATKLEDDIYDENSPKAKLMKKLYSKQIKKAKQMSPQMYKILKEGNEKIHEQERKNKSLEEIETTFSNIMVEIGKQSFKMTEPTHVEALRMISKWIYLIDAIDDLDEDIKQEKFNPLKQYKSLENLRNTGYKKLGEHYKKLYKKVKPLEGKIKAPIVNHIIYGAVPNKTIKILERE